VYILGPESHNERSRLGSSVSAAPRACDRHFPDAGEYCAALRATHIEFLPFSRTRGKWRLGTADLGRFTVWWGRVPTRGAGVGVMPAASALVVVACADAPGWRINREPLTSGRIALIPARADYACVVPAASWFALALPQAWLEAHPLGAAHGAEAGRTSVSFLELGAGAARIRRALVAARRQVLRDPSLLDDARSRSALRRSVLDALLDSIPEGVRAHHPENRLLARLTQFLHGHRERPLWTADLCEALATTPRSLRRVFPDAFGITPGRYLRLRRLHLARRALVSGTYRNVTAAAMHYGFFDLGRFSAAYRRHFGEMPSAALRKGPAARLG
jgi:AraC-like DNA-binding protein